MTDEILSSTCLPPQPRSRRGFRIAIICALPLEVEMVEMLLDHDWSDTGAKYGKATGDKNTYTAGVLGGQNIIIAYMPFIGGIDAASVAAGLRSSFPKVEFAFVVGICGAVPKHPETKQDIFLGDCIISTSIVQYDFGAQYPAGFEKKNLDNLGRASPEVRSLIAKLTTRRNHKQLTMKTNGYLTDLLKLCSDVKFPGTERDRLFQAEYIHRHTSSNCESCQENIGTCRKDCDTIECDSSFIVRRERQSMEPRIHFGCFGSGNTVMKSGQHRDEIARDKLVAFEMEGIGVWNAFPTIVIKSVSDYADSHKSDEWQGYAAASAAAGLKAVLEKLEMCDEQLGQDVQLLTELNEIEMQCLHSLSLQPSYRDMKDRTTKRVEGTCNWALSQDAYSDWLGRDGGKLLISADPGCGKSVLAKYLIDEVLPKALPDFVICYYFFRDQVQNRLAPALCAICHQLMSQNYSLLRKHAVPQYQRDQNMANNPGTLVGIIRKAISDKSSPSVVIVFDALDECDSEDCKRLIELLDQLDDTKKLKIILTSRPYYGIVSAYEAVSSRLHIPGEEESEAISKEVNIVVKQRLGILCQQKQFDNHIRGQLESRLLAENHRTYLWIYLVFDELETALKMTAKELETFFDSLPRTVNEAYERILSRSNRDMSIRKIVRTTLSILLAAYRALTVKELQHAVKAGIRSNAKKRQDLDIEPDGDFIVKLRNQCGLFVQVYDGKVTFIHQTAREFLISSDISDTQVIGLQTSWKGSCTIEQAHAVIARACIAYLLIYTDSMEVYEYDAWDEGGDKTLSLLAYAAQHWDRHVEDGSCTDDQELLTRMSFLCDPQKDARDVWFVRSRSYFDIYVDSVRGGFKAVTEKATYAAAVSCLRTNALMKSALTNAYTEFEDRIVSNCPDVVTMAVLSGHPKNLRSLLEYAREHRIKVNLNDELMHIAVREGRTDCVEILLEYGASPNVVSDEDSKNSSHLGWASHRNDLNMVRLLVKHGVNLEELDFDGYSPLCCAIIAESEDITEFLISHGAEIHALGENGKTPLHEAVLHSSKGPASILLDHMADTEAQDDDGSTALHVAAAQGDVIMVNLLISFKATIDIRNKEGMTPLARAVCGRNLKVVQILIQHGADINTQDDHGRSILHHAIMPQVRGDGLITTYDHYRYRHNWEAELIEFLDRDLTCVTEIIRLLLEHGARQDLRDEQGYTPLSLAAYYQMQETMEILLSHRKDSLITKYTSDLPYICIQEHRPYLLQFLVSSGINMSIQHKNGNWFVHGLIKCYHGRVTLHVACYVELTEVTTLITPSWKDIDSKDESISSSSYEEFTQLAELVGHSLVDIKTRDVLGCSPLLSYSRMGCGWAVKRLLDRGIDVSCRDIYGGTSLHWASRCGSEDTVRKLLNHGADINAFQDSKFTALTVAMMYDRFELFNLLLEYGAHTHIPDIHGRRVLHHAVCLDSEPFSLPRFNAIAFLSCILKTEEIGVDAQDHGGWTALHWAAAKDFSEAVKLLLKHNADPNIRDNCWRTPMDYATVLGHRKVVAVFTEHEFGITIQRSKRARIR